MTVAETSPGKHVVAISPGSIPADGSAFRNFLRTHRDSLAVRVEFADAGFTGMAGWIDFLEICAEAAGRGVRLTFGGTASALSTLALLGVKGVVADDAAGC